MKLHRLILLTLGLAGIAGGVAVLLPLRGDSPGHVHAAICNATVPIGAVPPAVPEWCQLPLQAGIDTHTETSNGWLDDFNHGQTHATLNGSYVSFGPRGSISDAVHFQHNNHWMADVQAGGSGNGGNGGTTMRPNRSFLFEAGKLTIETDVAANISQYSGGAWAEVGISNAPAPTGITVDGLYAYGLFGGKDSFGCRFQDGAIVICALYAPNGNRTWEMSWFQQVAPFVYGGFPANELANVWRVCNGTDPDINCRDRFRLELTKTSVVLYVNGVRYFEQSGATLFPDSLVNAPVYAYFAGFVYLPGANVVTRFHWDRVKAWGGLTDPFAGPVTPTPIPPTPTPTNTPGPTNTPAPTATPTATATVGPATPTPTSTPATYRCQRRNANGSWTTVWSQVGGGSCP